MHLWYFFILAELAHVHCMSYKELDGFGPVVSAHVLYRHGDRTPINFYPNDPYRDLKYWPEGIGQLINIGKNRHYILGGWIGQNYKYLISATYDPNDIYIRSTDVDRCLMSAQANLAGMYPPVGWQVWSNLSWQPIPVHTIPQEMDRVLTFFAPCPKFSALFNLSMNKGLGYRWAREADNIVGYISKNSGMEVKTLIDLSGIYNSLEIEEMRGLTLPIWTKKVYPEPLKTFYEKFFKLFSLNNEMKRLRSGVLLKEMISHFNETINGTLSPPRKLWVYSAHDLTIASLMRTTGIYNHKAPPFATALLFELRELANSPKKYVVTVLLKNETYGDPYVLKIPKCSEACPYETFLNLTASVIPDDWDAECQIKEREKFQTRMFELDRDESIFPEGWNETYVDDGE